MEMVEIKAKVPKSADELAKAVGALMELADKQLEDGFQPGTDVTALVIAAFANLVPAVGAAKALPGDTSGAPLGVAHAVTHELLLSLRKMRGEPLDTAVEP